MSEQKPIIVPDDIQPTKMLAGEITCPNCGGIGTKENLICPVCNGNGTVLRTIPVLRWIDENRWYFKFPFCRFLLGEIKALYGRKWHKDEKIWSAPVTPRNNIAIKYLTIGEDDPFELFSRPLESHQFSRDLWPHQQTMANFALTRHYCILAAEQGTGKTLSLIEVMEQSGAKDNEIWYVAPLSALEAVRLELKKWNSAVKPILMTYERLVRVVKNWDGSSDIPRVLIGDESSRVKSPTSQRSAAFQNVADVVREVYGPEGYVILATGTPAPRSPIDWWKQCEIAYPGYLRESTARDLKNRLAKYVWIENEAGGWPELVTWWDDPEKCAECGQHRSVHDANRPDCKFRPSVNELELLHERLNGLVTVLRKKDVQAYLPDKHYRIVSCKPNKTLLEQAKLLTEVSETAIEALIGCRALSDGFQYFREKVGEKECPRCKGTGRAEEFVKLDQPDDTSDSSMTEDFDELPEDFDFVKGEGECYKCGGTGKVDILKRNYIEMDSPKLKKLEHLLEEYEEAGRVIIYAGFHASIDRITKLCLQKKWTVFVVDGRGWRGISPSGDTYSKKQLVELFQDPNRKIDQIAWVAHPKSSGMGLTLTASPVEIFYSNTFEGEDRMQAEDRAHRPGMDEAKGLTIIDMYNLSTDRFVRNNLVNKINLQSITLGAIQETLDAVVEEDNGPDEEEEIVINDDTILDAYSNEDEGEL